MAHIFMDESGDLGFSLPPSGKSSKYFIVTILFTNNSKQLEKLIKSTYSTLRKKHRKKGRVLHAYNEKPETRKRVLDRIAKTDTKIMSICLNKAKVYTDLRAEKNILYNFVTNILLDRIYTKKLIPLNSRIELIAERKDTNKFLTQNFKDYLTKQTALNHKLDIIVRVLTGSEEKCLQAADFVSWAIFRKYEKADDYYYNIIKDNIFEENSLFK